VKRPVLSMLAVLAILVLPGVASDSWAGPPPCDTRCSCAVSCDTLCSNGGAITCGFYGDCIDLCDSRAAAATSPVVTNPPALEITAPAACPLPQATPAVELPAFLQE
jgi:hypothetical protein